MNCKDVEPLLSAFIDGELGPDLRESVEGHAAACGRCSQRMESLRLLSPASFIDRSAPDTLRTRVLVGKPRALFMRRVFAPVLALVLLSLILLFAMTPSKAMAAYKRMRQATIAVHAVHMTTYTSNPVTGARDRGDTWVAYGSWRREGLRGMRGLRGVNGHYDYSTITGVMKEDTTFPTVSRSAELFTVESLTGSASDSDPSVEILQGSGSWNGKSVLTLRVTEREHQLYSQELHQGVTSPASMVDFMIDPVTYLPLHYVQYRREGEEWKATNTIDFEFNLDLPREMFTPASLRKRYASWEPQPTP